MEKLPEVEAAKALMTEAVSWSVMRWLKEKKRVRKTADQANAALDRLADALQKRWPEQLTLTYEALPESKDHNSTPGGEFRRVAHAIKRADEEAFQARMEAERIFDEAERKLSTPLAREGCRKAIHAWELKEKAIRKIENPGC
jgi:hypothetical protein